MLAIWNKISNIGTEYFERESDKKNVILSNRILIVIFGMNWVLFGVSVHVNGIAFNNLAIGITNIVTVVMILSLNSFGHSVYGRLLLCWMASIGTFLITILSKTSNPELIDELYYITPRLFILSTTMIPLLIFSFREIRPLVMGLLSGFIPIFFFDNIHNALGIGYYDMGFNSGSYPFAVVLSFTCYILFVSSGIFFKRINERYESKNISLIESLEQKNLEVEQNAEALKTANAQIQSNNKNLEALVELRTKKVIEQAQKFQAFSQKNSHELRAPLTNIMALLDQLKNTNSDETREQILQHLEKACIDLDRVIHDINDLLSSDK